MKPKPGEIDEARRFPNGYVYRIDGNFSVHEAIPPERIIGAWKVDDVGKITGAFVPSPNYKPSARKVRRGGVKKALLGGIVFGITIISFYQLSKRQLIPNDPHLLALAGMPFAVFGIGVVEFIAGSPFQRLADSWMNLRGWQRGVLGTFLVLFSMIAIICLMAFVCSYL